MKNCRIVAANEKKVLISQTSEKQEILTKFSSKHKVKSHMEYLKADRKIILKFIWKYVKYMNLNCHGLRRNRGDFVKTVLNIRVL